MPPPPPVYFELADTVASYLTKGSELDGWSIDALEEPEEKKFQVFPFASPTALGIHLLYSDPDRGLKVHSKVTSQTASAAEVLPSVTYTAHKDGHSYSVKGNLSRTTLTQTFETPAFHATLRTKALDGLASLATATTRLSPNVVVGCRADYDPKRSGLKDLALTAVRYGCPNVGGGDLLARYSLVDGLGLHVRVPIHPYLDAAVMAEKRRFIAGVQARSPCGARMMLNANVNEGTVTATAIRNLNDIWKLSMTFTTAPLGGSTASGAAVPRFGLKFSNCDMLDVYDGES